MEKCSAVSDGSGPTTIPSQAPILLPDSHHLDSYKLLLLHSIDTTCTDAMTNELPALAGEPASQHLRRSLVCMFNMSVLHLLGKVQRKVQILYACT